MYQNLANVNVKILLLSIFYYTVFQSQSCKQTKNLYSILGAPKFAEQLNEAMPTHVRR
jgi:hypothetical protein